MAYNLNFSLLGAPVDVRATVNAGFERGREMRLRGEQERAFGLLSRDPNSAEGRALLVESGRPDLARQFHTWGREDRRDAYHRAALGDGPPPGALGPPAFAPSTPGMGPNLPVAPPSGAPPAPPAPTQPPAPVAPPAASTGPGQLNPQLMRQFFAEDPAGARELLTAWNAMNAAQQAQASRQYAAAVPILAEVARMPLAERGQAVLSQADYLISQGWTREQLETYAANPSDQITRMLLRRGVPIAEQREFFAPDEAAPGTIGRDPVTGGVVFANPSPPREQRWYDTAGNEHIDTIPGSPAIGPDARLFGADVQSPQLSPAGLPQPGAVVNGHRYRGPAVTDPNDPALHDRNNWERVQGGAGQPQARRTFPSGQGVW